jgi:hypothetical protein
MPSFTISWDEHKEYTGEFADRQAARAWWLKADTQQAVSFHDVEFSDLIIAQEDGLADSGILCPDCGDGDVHVVAATLSATGDRIDLDAPLSIDGFEFDRPSGVEDGSTEDEIARCETCGRQGDLSTFGFGG